MYYSIAINADLEELYNFASKIKQLLIFIKLNLYVQCV